MKTQLPEKIETVKEAEAFLKALIANNEHFHPEDDASEIITSTGEDLFDEWEASKINKLMGQIWDLNEDFDPCGFILDNDPVLIAERLEDRLTELKSLGCVIKGENIHLQRETLATKKNLKEMSSEDFFKMITEIKEFIK